MKALIVGAAGQLGGQLLEVITPERAIPAARTPGVHGWASVDLAALDDADILARQFGQEEIGAIYCAGGMTNVDGCEEQRDLAFRTNSAGPKRLAKYAADRGIPFVYLSTEYVFDGFAGPYDEAAQPNPLSVYGESKLAGERAVFEVHPTALIIRTTVVYGFDHQQKNFLYGVARNLTAGQKMRVPADQISTPTYNTDLAVVSVSLVVQKAHGIFHVCGPELMSRVQMAYRAASFLDLDPRLIDPVTTASLAQKARRPLCAGLSIGKLQDQFPALTTRGLEQGVSDWIKREPFAAQSERNDQ